MPRECSVCRHPNCQDIDRALLAGQPLIPLADCFGLSRSALSRHHQHLKKGLQQAQRDLSEQLYQAHLAQLVALLQRTLSSLTTIHLPEHLATPLAEAQQLTAALKDLLHLRLIANPLITGKFNPSGTSSTAPSHLAENKDTPVNSTIAGHVTPSAPDNTPHLTGEPDTPASPDSVPPPPSPGGHPPGSQLGPHNGIKAERHTDKKSKKKDKKKKKKRR